MRQTALQIQTHPLPATERRSGILPALVWTGIAQRAGGAVFRRFAFGAGEVRLHA